MGLHSGRFGLFQQGKLQSISAEEGKIGGNIDLPTGIKGYNSCIRETIVDSIPIEKFKRWLSGELPREMSVYIRIPFVEFHTETVFREQPGRHQSRRTCSDDHSLHREWEGSWV